MPDAPAHPLLDPEVMTAPIIRRFGSWAVTRFGVECLVTEYSIGSDQLAWIDWPAHMARKRWMTPAMLADFGAAFAYAREVWG